MGPAGPRGWTDPGPGCSVSELQGVVLGRGRGRTALSRQRTPCGARPQPPFSRTSSLWHFLRSCSSRRYLRSSSWLLLLTSSMAWPIWGDTQHRRGQRHRLPAPRLAERCPPPGAESPLGRRVLLPVPLYKEGNGAPERLSQQVKVARLHSQERHLSLSPQHRARPQLPLDPDPSSTLSSWGPEATGSMFPSLSFPICKVGRTPSNLWICRSCRQRSPRCISQGKAARCRAHAPTLPCG